ncbi:hypothetical protein, partial [Acinetobacter baumannii]|uniref:hypothetical protein n=1 Tax=Acinetobacter baumannii TaxID=470 RepID=UPI001C07834F
MEKYNVLFEVVAAGNSKKYLGKNYTHQDIDEMALDDRDILLERLNSVQQAEYTRSLSETFCTFTAELSCKYFKIENVDGVKHDLINDPFTQ